MDDKKLLQRLINQVAKDKNADPTQVKDFLARVVALESGRSFDSTIKQKTEKGTGPGRGITQIETNGKGGSNRIVSTIGRAVNYYNSKNEKIPEFISDIKDEIYTNGTFDVSNISKEKQLLLTLADFRMGNGNLGDVFSGKMDVSEMWINHWWQGKDSEKEKKLKYYHDTMKSYDQNEFFSNLYDEDLNSNKEEFKFENMKSSNSPTLDAFAKSSSSGNNFNDLLNSIQQKTSYNNTIQSYDKLQFTEQDFEKSLKDFQQASTTEGNEFNIKPVENTFNQGGNINKNFNFRTKQINSFNEGGLHSENPLGGIPQGIGKNGKPNLVEEGESSYTFKDGSKFIFSDKGLINSINKSLNKNSNNQFAKGGNINNSIKKDPPNEVYYGTPEYKKAYKEGRIQGQELDEVVVTADKRTGKNILEDYPFYNELSEQEKEYFRDSSPIGTQIRARARDSEGVTADKASAMGAQVLQGAGSALQVPQSAMVEGVEALRGNEYDFNSVLPGNKQRVPSNAWGYDTEGLSWHHPKSIANFAMDVVLDPENIAGAGIVARKPLQKGITKTGQALTTETPLKDIWKLNPQARKAFKNVDEQPHWLKGFQEEWNPTTPEQLQEMQNFLNKADEEWSKVIFNQDGANQKLVKYNKQRRKEQHKKNIGEDYSQDKINKIGQQIDKELGIDKTPLKSFINKLGRGSFGDVFEVEGAKAIKRIHSSEDLPINIKDIANKYKSLPKELQERVVVPFSAHGEGVGKIELMKKIEGAKDMKNAFSIDNKNVDNVIKDIKALNDKGIYVDLSNPDNILLDPKTNKATFLDLNTDKNIMDVTNYGKNTIVEKIKKSL